MWHSPKESPVTADGEKLVLNFLHSPGDTLVIGTTAMESLHKAYPGEYITDVSGTASEALFEANPLRTRLLGEGERIDMHYPLINQGHMCHNFLEAGCHYLSQKLGRPIPLCVNHPILHLSDQEKGWVNQVEQHHGFKGKFWLICSGVKSDYTVKAWGRDNYQSVVNKLRGTITFVQIGEAHHAHPGLDGVINLVGQTDTRQLIRLAYHAQGGLGGESLLHHIFAAFRKPFVCLQSGFLPKGWISYGTSRILERHGCLPCCATGGCGAARVIPLNDSDSKDKSLCRFPILGGHDAIPKCLAMIKPDEVVEAIMSFYIGNVLSFA